MKSKEEFEKSVFAKRDALLKKRKNAIITAVSLGCTTLCLTVAASAIKPMKTADAGGTGETEIYYNGALPHNETEEELGGLFWEDNAKENEKTTAIADAEGAVEETFNKCGENESVTFRAFGYSEENAIEEDAEYMTMTEIYWETSVTKKPHILAGETALASEAGELATEIVTEPYFESEQSSVAAKPQKKYPTDEEIIAAALSYLTDSEKASIINDTPPITMTHYTDQTKGDEYTLYFKTTSDKIKIVLLVDTLELVEKK